MYKVGVGWDEQGQIKSRMCSTSILHELFTLCRILIFVLNLCFAFKFVFIVIVFLSYSDIKRFNIDEIRGRSLDHDVLDPHESSPDSDLEAFSHNSAHDSFAPLAFQPSAMTNCVN
ncbi:hypothetical protein H5410_012578 [Solanum commersonii]|uniref:Uncharacterized protein n=1 Tax=Solanum commersonii TaxID=4109 RepID=A0A9J6ARY5_SOLCO|nr:hypothetical protein H5410_012578 [Solanum commersonii]